MIDSSDLSRLQPLIAAAGVDGCLLLDFRGRNPIAAAVLGAEIVGSRRVYVLIPPQGKPTALVHAVDAELWRGWPAEWPERVWVHPDELTAELGALVTGRRLAVDWSPGAAIPYLDGIPLGVGEVLRELGAELVPSADLVTRYCSVWTAAQRAGHRRAASAIATIARGAPRARARHLGARANRSRRTRHRERAKCERGSQCGASSWVRPADRRHRDV